MMSFLSIRWVGTLAVLSVMFAAAMFGGAALTPDPMRAHNTESQFDARAARQRLERILGDETPHPVDSAAEDAVRERLLREIEALGFEPSVRDDFACRAQPRGPLIDCARVRNIIFSVGPENGPAVLAAAHYDSVAAAPGASDDGIGVSVWLEIARMLAREQLTRRVIFLFSDGEEQGLLGAHAFATADPLMSDVESLVNLEARGSRGPAIFFESNQPNGDAVAAFAGAPRPVANSVMADAYALMSNSSDVTALARPGLDVLNIALLDGLEDYHTPRDTIASQDLRSVQHMGDAALAVTLRLARAPDADAQAPMIYTDIASRAFVAMPGWVGQVALALSALVAALALWRSGAEGRWRALAAPIVTIAIAGVLAFGIGFVLSVAKPGADLGFAHPAPMRALCILAALLAALLALMSLRSGRLPDQTGSAAMLWFAAIGGVSSIFVSGISILFALPASGFAAGALAGLAWKPARALGAWFAAIAAIVIWAPLLWLIELALGFETPFAFSIVAALMVLPWLGVVAHVRGDGSWRQLVLMAALGVTGAAAAAALTPTMSEARPRALNITYFLNTSDNQARVLAGSAERALPESLAGLFTPEPILPGDRAETWAAPAPVEAIAPPALEELSVTHEDGRRLIRVRLAMHGAYRAIVRMPVTARPVSARVNGVATLFANTGAEEDDEYVNVACQGRSCDGAAIEILTEADVAGDWYVIGQFPGRTTPASDALRARRGPTATPIQAGDGATTLSRFRPH